MLNDGAPLSSRRKRDQIKTMCITAVSTVAMLCLCGMLHSPFANQSTQVESPTDILATHSARRFNKDKPILMLHIRKTGGTTLCNAAMEYDRGEWRLPADMPRHANCNPSVYFFWFHSQPPSVPSQMWCEELYEREIVGRNATVAFLEFPLHSTLPCKEFRTMVVLREPVARSVSDLLQESITSLPHAMTEYAIWIDSGKGPSASYWKNRFLVDNVYIRTILGTSKYFARRQMNRNDLEQAKAALLQFEWVVFMDEMDDTIGELNSEHGWDLKMPSHGAVQPSVSNNQVSETFFNSSSKRRDRRLLADMQRVRKDKPAWTKHWKLTQLLTERNSLDIELYNFAKETFSRNKKVSQRSSGLAMQPSPRIPEVRIPPTKSWNHVRALVLGVSVGLVALLGLSMSVGKGAKGVE